MTTTAQTSSQVKGRRDDFLLKPSHQDIARSLNHVNRLL
jgi:hypothetical protein